ncbi:uncharacterized protein APUU_21302S [Aspergillus puulaauensis]|uniref:Methyltransferase n=1 Tax=Aspergillus puulaauensis TaxID=1220207 RepID=A0A7R7XG82_9EURO|nr:uncharacterized protein APUU_21302S [Aspergillus puulaauensis]BCS20870.1 hypothetical protein APUU_21302S [Aspergillus puulaauensis]
MLTEQNGRRYHAYRQGEYRLYGDQFTGFGCRELLIEASTKFGKQLGVANNYKQWMVGAGFGNVQEHIYKVPFSPWAKGPKLKELGRYHQTNMLEVLEAYSLALMTRSLGWTVEDVNVLLREVRKELLDRKLHIYSRLYVVYGQK